ncbi:MAG: hypothetical protein AAGI22_13185 [Planctomycetota bacterium]
MTRSEYEPPRPGQDGLRSDAVLDDPRTVETLARYDEASADELAALEKDPRAAQILERLKEADRWLAASLEGADAADETAAVTPEELYDYGGGPGATALDPERRKAVKAHLLEHPEEAALVRTLDRPIPSPIEFEPTEPRESRIRALRRIPGVASVPSPGTRPVPTWLAWGPLAAAALILAMFLGGDARQNALGGGLPESPVLRSAQSEALLFPRSRVLAPVEGATTYASRPLFEVTPIDGATEYRFELRGGADGAFEEGVVVWTATAMSPFASSFPLEEGAYSWSAWARVDGLERSLGALTFHVVMPSPGDILRSAAGVESDSGSAREDVRRLHAAGFLTDARHRARALPPGEDRARYLSEDR